MEAVSYATRCTAKVKGSELCYAMYVLSAVGCVTRVLVTWDASAFDLLFAFLLRPIQLKYVVSSATGDAMA